MQYYWILDSSCVFGSYPSDLPKYILHANTHPVYPVMLDSYPSIKVYNYVYTYVCVVMQGQIQDFESGGSSIHHAHEARQLGGSGGMPP